jgi:hypothetical protein
MSFNFIKELLERPVSVGFVSLTVFVEAKTGFELRLEILERYIIFVLSA